MRRCEICDNADECTLCRPDVNTLKPPYCLCALGFYDNNQTDTFDCEPCLPKCLSCLNNQECLACKPQNLTGYCTCTPEKGCTGCYPLQFSPPSCVPDCDNDREAEICQKFRIVLFQASILPDYNISLRVEFSHALTPYYIKLIEDLGVEIKL